MSKNIMDIDRVAPPPLSLAEQIANSVAEMVINGELEPGVSIPEPRLASYFQVSRGPVREALRILERDGVVTISPRRGARVTKLTTEELGQVFVIRAALFGLAVGLFATAHSAAQLERLEALFADMRALTPADNAIDEHVRLSTEMAALALDGCGNPRLRDLVLQLARQVARYTRLGLSSPERRRQSLESWQALVTQVRDRDSVAAEAVGRQMVSNTRQHALEVLALERASD